MRMEFEDKMGLERALVRGAKLASLVCAAMLCMLAMAHPLVARPQSQGQPLNQTPQPVEQDDRPVIRLIRDPEPAPAFAVKGLDGQTVSLESARGKVVLLSFWATWCGPCRMEVPDLVELQNKYKDRLQVIGLVVDDPDEQAVRAFVKTYAVTYPVAMATDEMRYQFGGVPALPTCFIIDAQGRVVQKHIGLRDPALYETEIRALLGLPIHARVETFVDTGEVFLKNASRASALPGVDMTRLSAAQKTVALHRMNAEGCTCGCKYTLAQCRIYDQGCQISQGRTAKIVAECAGQPPTASPGIAPTPEVRQNAAPSSSPPPVAALPSARP
jgi:cytochrome c biogenesis protein CcmG, thiol:disulfide interchange protein DsbE